MRRRPIVLLFSRSRRGGVMERRAHELAVRARPVLDVRVLRRREPPPRGLRPDAVYVFDSVPAELAAAARLRVPLILEAGDVVAELRRKAGVTNGRVRALALLERAAWLCARSLVVRGEGFREVLARRGVGRRIDVLPDGVDLHAFRPLPPDGARARLGLAPSDVAVGVVGTIAWSACERTAYGWELVEALPLVPEHVKAVVVGDGTGLARLRHRAHELGVADRLLTPGHVAHADIPEVLAALDAVTWTQTPDAVGLCRTTMKLPEYLATGKFVLASDVGEAKSVVNGNGIRLPYRGGRDPSYVAAVARAVTAVVADPAAARARGLAGVARARRYDWDRVAAGFVGVVERTLAGNR